MFTSNYQVSLTTGLFATAAVLVVHPFTNCLSTVSYSEIFWVHNLNQSNNNAI